jgi:hypothetical protein
MVPPFSYGNSAFIYSIDSYYSPLESDVQSLFKLELRVESGNTALFDEAIDYFHLLSYTKVPITPFSLINRLATLIVGFRIDL